MSYGTLAAVRSVLPPKTPVQPLGYVPKSEDDAVRFMAPYAWNAFKRMKLTWVGPKAADLTQAFLLGVALCFREKWDPSRGSFWSAAMWCGIHEMRNEMTAQNSRRCVDSAFRWSTTIEDWMPAFQVGAFAETRIAANEVVEALMDLAETPAEVEAARSFILQEAPDHEAIGVTYQRMYQIRNALLQRFRLGQTRTARTSASRPPTLRETKAALKEPVFTLRGPRRDFLTIPEHVAAGRSQAWIAQRFVMTACAVREALKRFRKDVALFAPDFPSAPMGPPTKATARWYRDALVRVGVYSADQHAPQRAAV